MIKQQANVITNSSPTTGGYINYINTTLIRYLMNISLFNVISSKK